jgi:hypothetical protein
LKNPSISLPVISKGSFISSGTTAERADVANALWLQADAPVRNTGKTKYDHIKPGEAKK